MEWLQREIYANFSSRPSDPLSLRVREAEVPCSADILLGFNPAGFGSKVTRMMHVLAMAAYGNFSVAMYAGKEKGFQKVFDSFFKNSIPVCNKVIKDKHTPIQGLGAQFWGKLVDQDSEYATNAQRTVYAQHLIYTDAARDRVEKTLDDMGLDKSAKFLGVHIRHGDKVSETPNIPTDTYGHKVAEADLEKVQFHAYSKYAQVIRKQSSGTKTVWLATVDVRAAEELGKSLGDDYEIKCLNCNAVKWHGSKHSEDFYYPNSTHVFDLLTDVEALRRSDHFIGTGSSNIGRLVYFMRPAGSKSTSLDTSFAQ